MALHLIIAKSDNLTSLFVLIINTNKLLKVVNGIFLSDEFQNIYLDWLEPL